MIFNALIYCGFLGLSSDVRLLLLMRGRRLNEDCFGSGDSSLPLAFSWDCLKCLIHDGCFFSPPVELPSSLFAWLAVLLRGVLLDGDAPLILVRRSCVDPAPVFTVSEDKFMDDDVSSVDERDSDDGIENLRGAVVVDVGISLSVSPSLPFES